MFSLVEYFIQNDQRNICVLVSVIDKTEVIVLGPKNQLPGRSLWNQLPDWISETDTSRLLRPSLLGGSHEALSVSASLTFFTFYSFTHYSAFPY